MPKTPKSPPGLGAAGRRLWRDVLARYDLDPHELALLAEAAKVADECNRLAALASIAPPEDPDWRALRELRAQRTLLSRLIVCLRLPDAEQGTRPQRRGPRGAYARLTAADR